MLVLQNDENEGKKRRKGRRKGRKCDNASSMALLTVLMCLTARLWCFYLILLFFTYLVVAQPAISMFCPCAFMSNTPVAMKDRL